MGPLLPSASQIGEIGLWQEIDPSEDYYKKNEYIQSDDETSEELNNELQEIENKIDDTNNQNNTDNQTHEQNAIDQVLELKNETNFGKSTLKLKNERLIKLVENNFELGNFEKPTFKKGNQEELDSKEPILIKKRFVGNKIKIIDPNDI